MVVVSNLSFQIRSLCFSLEYKQLETPLQHVETYVQAPTMNTWGFKLSLTYDHVSWQHQCYEWL